MHKTPPHLVARYGLPAETAARKIPSWLLAYTGPHRKEFLALFWCLIACGALDEYGGDPKRVKKLSQGEIAQRLGISRSTLNRWIQMFSDPDGRWDDDRRERFSQSQRLRCELEGKKLRGRARRQVRRIHTFLNKQVGFGQVQMLTTRMDPALKPQIERGQKKSSKTADVEMAAAAFGAEWFDPTREGCNNYKASPEWSYMLPDVTECPCVAGQLSLQPDNPCAKCNGVGTIALRDKDGDYVPLPDFGTALFQYLVLKGIMQFKTVDNISLRVMAEDLGTDENTIAKYRDKLELLQIIRVVSGDIYKRCLRDGTVFVCRGRHGQLEGSCFKCGATHGTVVMRKPDKWTYIADRLLDDGIAEREYRRFQELHGKVQHEAFEKARTIHVELLQAWRGKEHSLKAFFNEMRRRLASASMHRDVVDVLIPPYLE